MPITARTARLKQRCRWKHVAGGEYVDPSVRGGIERPRYLTEAHKQTAGEPEVIRRAKALANVLNKITIHIQEDELIVGSNTEHPDYFPLYPELSYFATIDMVESPYCVNKEEMRAIAEYWRPYTIQSKCEKFFTQEELDVMYSAATVQPPLFVSAYSSIVPNYESVLEDGLYKRMKVIAGELQEANKQLRSSPWIAKEKLSLLDKINVWEAMLIADRAVIAWARRYSRLAKIIAEKFESDQQRKDELMEISDICWRMPAEPAIGFRDAMQSKWFVYLLCHSIERYASGFAQKEDKLLWPYYRNSVIEKLHQPMNREQAQELIECERLKVSEHGSSKGRQIREFLAGANDLFILTVGGTNADGSDGSNECTDVILDAAESLVTPEPSIGFRWSKKGRAETKRRVFNCIKKGLGYPSIKNDELNTSQLVKYFGVPEEKARDWALVLCMSPGITGRRATQKTRSEGGSDVYPAKCLELALSDGFDHFFTGIQLGPHTGDPKEFKSIEDVWAAFRAQLRYAVELILRAKDIGRVMEVRYLCCPFISSIDDGCVEKGMDANELTEVPNPWHNIVGGNIVVADSIVAMKKLIFEEKKYTLAGLIDALQTNWEGKEDMRLEFWNAPKFGNDDDYADDIAKEYYDLVAAEWKRNEVYSGTYPLPLAQSVAGYIVNGPKTGATPNGRKAGEVMDDGGVAPYMGCDQKGPTAVLKSVAKIDHTKHKGLLLNQRLSPAIMRSAKGFDLWHAYVKTWHSLGCDHVQFNVVSTEEMQAAQVDPEKHSDLLVRVAGYSARFTNLTKYSQDSIMARTEHELEAPA